MYAIAAPRPTHFGRHLFLALLVVVGLVVLVVALVGPQANTAGTRPTPRPAVVYNHDTLERDATMTQGFGNATADPTRLPPTARQQLQNAGDPAFRSELEQHQQQIDQMLGATPYQR